MPSSTDKWIVKVHGNIGKRCEISVMRDSYVLGHRSWGWFCDRKIHIGDGYESSHWYVMQGLVELAHNVCESFNSGTVDPAQLPLDSNPALSYQPSA